MSEQYAQFMQTYSGQELLKKHSLDEEGTWEILGEDPNYDFGGHHHNPQLGIYTGRLRDIIDMAVEMRSFSTWGGGGLIRKVNITKVDRNTVKLRNELANRERQLQEELSKVQQQLKSL